MSIENKLRKFKLIDKQGWLSFHGSNSCLYRDYFDDQDMVEGVFNSLGSFVSIDGARVILTPELKFFKEILPEQETPTPEESLYWREGTPLKAGLIVGRNCSGEREYFVKYVGDSFAVLADKREETTSAISNLRSLVKSEKEVVFEKVLAAWKGLSLENAYDSRDNLGSFFDLVYDVMKGE